MRPTERTEIWVGQGIAVNVDAWAAHAFETSENVCPQNRDDALLAEGAARPTPGEAAARRGHDQADTVGGDSADRASAHGCSRAGVAVLVGDPTFAVGEDEELTTPQPGGCTLQARSVP
jgi:hypothetical protein